MKKLLLAALVGLLPIAALADSTITGPITFKSPSTTVSGSKVSVPTATTLVTGLVKPDGSTITISAGIITAASTAINGTSCTPGGSCTITAAATGVTVGTTTVGGGTTGRVLYDNTGVLGEMTTTGTGTVLALASSPVLVTPTLGDATATTVNKLTLTPPASGATLTIADGKTATDTSGVGAVALKGATGGGFAQAACGDLSNAGTGCTAGAASTSTAGIAKLHNVPVAIGWPAGLDPNNIVIANINQTSTISAIIGAVDAAVGSAATVSVYKAASGTACSAGTVLHSGSFDANGSANTNQTLTVTTASLAIGDRLCLVTTGGANWTGGSGVGGVTVFLAPS